MALLSGLNAIAKGAASSIGLDKTTLFGLSKVAADAWFSVQANVAKVKVVYKSSQGGQKVGVKFDMSSSSPSGQVKFSSSARNDFQIHKVILYDFDGDSLVLEAADLPSGLGISL